MGRSSMGRRIMGRGGLRHHGERRSFFPWERRGGLFRRLGLYRLRPLLGVAVASGLLVLVVVREREAAGVRRTRSILLDVREAVDAYRADRQGQCPENFAALSDYSSFHGVPRDAWGQPLTLICPGSEPGQAYVLMSAGPDGIAGGLDRIE
jgi:general secretion pathway protein G